MPRLAFASGWYLALVVPVTAISLVLGRTILVPLRRRGTHRMIQLLSLGVTGAAAVATGLLHG